MIFRHGTKIKSRRTGLRTELRNERASVVESALETIQRLRKKGRREHPAQLVALGRCRFVKAPLKPGDCPNPLPVGLIR